MTRIVSCIRIRCPIETVFDYVTTPANWPAWHPASRAVGPEGSRPLRVGESVTENFSAAGRRGRARWRVTGRDAPTFWRIEAESPEGRATIVYRLRAEEGETEFMRELDYDVRRALLALLDMVYIRARMERESAAALLALKRGLERAAEGPPDGPVTPYLAAS